MLTRTEGGLEYTGLVSVGVPLEVLEKYLMSTMLCSDDPENLLRDCDHTLFVPCLGATQQPDFVITLIAAAT